MIGYGAKTKNPEMKFLFLADMSCYELRFLKRFFDLAVKLMKIL